MYAEHRYEPRQSRSVSLGAAFLINCAVMAGIVFLIAPKVGIRDIPTVLTGRNIPIEIPPPSDEPKPKPKAEPRTSSKPLIVAPKPRVPSDTSNPTATTDIIPPDPPLPANATGTGLTATPDVVPPHIAPPLVPSSQDMRYLKDFQPPYPASELRAERDGLVRLKVLIGVDGHVKAVEQLSATSEAFFDATRRQALSKWRFKPATRGGVPEESWKTMSVRFEIANQ